MILGEVTFDRYNSDSFISRLREFGAIYPALSRHSDDTRVLLEKLFEDCDFTGAQMHGTMLTRKQGTSFVLSSQQKTEIAWTDDEGEEPDGG
jgi:hypothetical protein